MLGTRGPLTLGGPLDFAYPAYLIVTPLDRVASKEGEGRGKNRAIFGYDAPFFEICTFEGDYIVSNRDAPIV